MGGIFWWFWHLGAQPVSAEGIARLVIEKGAVFIKTTEGVLEDRAHSGMALEEGNIIRTGEGSAASVFIPGRADLRLSENTTIDLLELKPSLSQGLVLRFKLESGKAWSRLMKLIDISSAYEGGTDNVVATVRGTAFGIIKDQNNTKVVVDHAGVRLGSASGEVKSLIKGEWAVFNAEGRITDEGSYASNTWPDADWLQANREADQKFINSVKQNAEKEFIDSLRIAPDHWARGLAVVSEGFHIALAKDKCDLKAAYTTRRLGEIYDLIQRGKSGMAFVELDALEKDIQNAKEEYDCEINDRLREKVGRIYLLLEDVMPENGLYRLKLRIEDLYAGLHKSDTAGALFAQSLSVDARLEEAERFDCAPDNGKSFLNAIEAAEKALARQQADLAQISGQITDLERVIMEEKSELQRRRLKEIQKKYEVCKNPPMEMEMPETATSTTSTEMADDRDIDLNKVNDAGGDRNQNQDTQEEPEERPNSEPPALPELELQREKDPRPENQSLDLSKIELFVQPNPVNIGEQATLYIKGYRRDGSTFDATPYADFAQIGNLGIFVGAARFEAQKEGTCTLTATVNDGGLNYSANTSLRISAPVQLDRIYLNNPGGGKIYQGENRTFSVTAYYTNQQSKTATEWANFSVSDPSLGYMSGARFTANMNASGWVTISASYTESGVTKTASISLEVISDTYQTTP